MIGEEDVLFRPVSRGWLKAESLIDGTVDLAYVMLLNEAIDVEMENDRRYTVAQKRRSGKHGG